MSLRLRLALLSGAIALSGLVLGVGISYLLLVRVALREVDQDLRLQATALLEAARTQGEIPPEVAEEILGGDTPSVARVYRGGHLVFEGGAPGAPWGLLSTVKGFASLEGWRVYRGGGGGWEVLVARPLTAYQSLLSWYLKLSLPVVLALGGLAFLGAYLLMGRALLPLVTLAQAAERFEEAPLSPRPDEVGALAQAFGRLLQRLKAERKREQAFLALASHELKTPIAALRAALEGLLQRGQADREALFRLRNQALRMEVLAENLLTLSRAQAGEARWEEVDLGEAAGAAFDRFQPLALRMGRELALEAQPIRVQADPRLLEQALNNLVYNALLHGKGTVWIRAFHQGPSAVLEVEDEGPGLLEPRREGLGLRVVRAVAKALGAELRLENLKGLRARLVFGQGKPPREGFWEPGDA